MSTTPQPPEPDKGASREEIEADIDATRERLADDVAALADKVNVPGQVKAKVNETRDNVGQAARHAQQQATAKARALPRSVRIGVPGALAALGLVLIIVGRRRRRSH
jgi:hypothetical protein